MTSLDDPELTLNGYYAVFYSTHLSFGAHHKNTNEDRHILSAAKCRPKIGLSSNVRFVQIFAGVCWKGV